MRRRATVIAVSLSACFSAVMSLAACCNYAPPPSPATGGVMTEEALRSFKGWELYAWLEGSSWRYALLVGTNRNKTDEEIAAAASRLDSENDVRQALARLAPDEWVTLRPRHAGGPLPPADVLSELKSFCEQHELHWQAAEADGGA